MRNQQPMETRDARLIQGHIQVIGREVIGLIEDNPKFRNIKLGCGLEIRTDPDLREITVQFTQEDKTSSCHVRLQIAQASNGAPLGIWPRLLISRYHRKKHERDVLSEEKISLDALRAILDQIVLNRAPVQLSSVR